MDHIWAPWRIGYILGKKPSECIFCAKGSQKNEEGKACGDDQNLVLLRGKSCFALLNAFPYTPGHLMIAPYQHTSELSELTRETWAEMMEMTCRCQGVLNKTMKPDGFNFGLNLGKAGGAGILEHLHFHLVPRWEGDTNFMPVLADTRVLPEGLNEIYAKLKKEI